MRKSITTQAAQDGGLGGVFFSQREIKAKFPINPLKNYPAIWLFSSISRFLAVFINGTHFAGKIAAHPGNFNERMLSVRSEP
ncbi:MAG: hypothetical protein IPJ07_20755 [Acidobacteria bacterium]|nr:hypothetical protein [Acidobacteriota bacterium]